jgi:Ion channel
VRWVALPAGIVLLVVTLLDVFSTLVMPRASRRRLRLTRLLFIATWRPWRWIGIRMSTQERRERVLAVAAPAFFFVLLVSWAGLAVLAYALILWSHPFAGGIGGTGDDSFATALYFSGTSLFTIGFGDVVATGWTRLVAVVQGATGLALVAVVIAYLPVLYAAFNRREVGILLLDARAGSPPSGVEILRRTCRDGITTGLPDLFGDWERWTADVLESHLSYPLLAYFRSPHDNTSWVTSLGAVLDAATLVLACFEHGHEGPARMLHDTGTHAVEDLWYFFGQPERRSLIERQEFDDVYRDLASTRVALRPPDEAWARFVELRAAYGPRLNALAVMLAAPPTQWIGDRSAVPVRTAETARRH